MLLHNSGYDRSCRLPGYRESLNATKHVLPVSLPMAYVYLWIPTFVMVVFRINNLNSPGLAISEMPHKLNLKRTICCTRTSLGPTRVDNVVDPRSIIFDITPPNNPFLVFFNAVFLDAVAMLLSPLTNSFVGSIFAGVGGLWGRFKSHRFVVDVVVLEPINEQLRRQYLCLGGWPLGGDSRVIAFDGKRGRIRNMRN